LWFFRSPDEVRGNEAAPHRTLPSVISLAFLERRNLAFSASVTCEYGE
jgi:hypothetical protein